MIVRIKLPRGRPLQRRAGKNRHLAFAFGALLIPASLMAYVLGIWRLASDMGVAGEFGISGLFSHWQIWIVLGVFMQIAASTFSRYGRGCSLHIPRFLLFRALPLRSAKESPAERET